MSLSTLTKRRGSVQAQLTKIQEHILKYNVEDGSVEEVNSFILKLQALEMDYLKLHGEILDKTKDEDEEGENVKMNAFLDKMIASQSHLHKLKNQLQNQDTPTTKTKAAAAAVRLPCIEIPQFHGGQEKWIAFKQLFMALVGNSNVDTVVKVLHLKNALRDEAADWVAHLEPIAENYELIWEELQDHYENQRCVVEKAARALLNLKPMKNESSKELSALISSCNLQLNILKSNKQEVGNVLVIQILSACLDKDTRRSWEKHAPAKEVPTLVFMMDFLTNQFHILESIEQSGDAQTLNRPKPSRIVMSTMSTSPTCPLCSGKHGIYHCDTFIKQTASDRMQTAKDLQLCFNCLSKNHQASECTSTYTCKQCQKSHNSLLHSSETSHTAMSTNVQMRKPKRTVLLSTAVILVKASNGEMVPCRALIDCASNANFVTERMAQELRLKKRHHSTSVNGINDISTSVGSEITATIKSRTSTFTETLKFLVIKKILDDQPRNLLDVSTWNIPQDIPLADPSFNQPGRIDMLLGVDIFWDLLTLKKIALGPNLPNIYGSQLGWLVGGRITPPDVESQEY